MLAKSDDKPGMLLQEENIHLVLSVEPNPVNFEFPGSSALRSTKHLKVLRKAITHGWAAMFYLVEREDSKEFSIAIDIDPYYENN